MGSQGQEQYVTVCEFVCVRVCVCWAVRKSMRHTAGRSYSSNKRTGNDMLPPPHMGKGEESAAGGCLSPSLSLSDSLPPYTRKSKSKVCRHVEL